MREKESERDSERRQRPFFDKLVTRRQASSLAKGGRVSSAEGGKRRGGRRLRPKRWRRRRRWRKKGGYVAGVGFYGDQ